MSTNPLKELADKIILVDEILTELRHKFKPHDFQDLANQASSNVDTLAEMVNRDKPNGEDYPMASFQEQLAIATMSPIIHSLVLCHMRMIHCMERLSLREMKKIQEANLKGQCTAGKMSAKQVYAALNAAASDPGHACNCPKHWPEREQYADVTGFIFSSHQNH